MSMTEFLKDVFSFDEYRDKPTAGQILDTLAAHGFYVCPVSGCYAEPGAMLKEWQLYAVINGVKRSHYIRRAGDSAEQVTCSDYPQCVYQAAEEIVYSRFNGADGVTEQWINEVPGHICDLAPSAMRKVIAHLFGRCGVSPGFEVFMRTLPAPELVSLICAAHLDTVSRTPDPAVDFEQAFSNAIVERLIGFDDDEYLYAYMQID